MGRPVFPERFTSGRRKTHPSMGGAISRAGRRNQMKEKKNKESWSLQDHIPLLIDQGCHGLPCHDGLYLPLVTSVGVLPQQEE